MIMLNKKVPTTSGRFLMGTFFIWFFTIQGQGKKLTTTQAIPTIQTFVTGATAYSNVSANIASRCIRLH